MTTFARLIHTVCHANVASLRRTIDATPTAYRADHPGLFVEDLTADQIARRVVLRDDAHPGTPLLCCWTDRGRTALLVTTDDDTGEIAVSLVRDGIRRISGRKRGGLADDAVEMLDQAITDLEDDVAGGLTVRPAGALNDVAGLRAGMNATVIQQPAPERGSPYHLSNPWDDAVFRAVADRHRLRPEHLRLPSDADETMWRWDPGRQDMGMLRGLPEGMPPFDFDPTTMRGSLLLRLANDVSYHRHDMRRKLVVRRTLLPETVWRAFGIAEGRPLRGIVDVPGIGDVRIRAIGEHEYDDSIVYIHLGFEDEEGA